MKKTLLSLLLGLGVSSHALGEDLYRVYQDAIKNDPSYLQSHSQKQAAFSAIDVSRASLLPQISLSLSASHEGGDADVKQNAARIGLRQSIWDATNWTRLDRAELVASQADANFALAKQDLILRTVSAYFNVLTAQDDLAFARAEKRAIERQLEQTKQRFEVGLTAITDVHEAQAQFDTSVADEIAAFNAVEISKEALREITGNYYADIKVLDTDRFSASQPVPTDINQWMQTAEQENFSLLAAKIAVDIAKEDIDLATAGHYPTFDLTASVSSSDREENGRNNDDRFNANSIGIEMSLPLYLGGRVSANVDTARHNFVSNSEDRERVYRSVVRSVRSSYYNVTAIISGINAFEQAVVSAESALRATEAGFDVGTRTIVDVLNSTRNLFNARRNLSNARYSYITRQLSLKQAAGVLTEQDVLDINQGLTTAE